MSHVPGKRKAPSPTETPNTVSNEAGSSSSNVMAVASLSAAPAPATGEGDATASLTKADDSDFERVLTREEKRKKKKLDKKKPKFQFDISTFKTGRKIGIPHIRELILHLVADGQKPNWLVVENKQSITHTCVLFVPGLLPAHLGLSPLPVVANLPFSLMTPAPPAVVANTVPSTEAAVAQPVNRVPVLAKLFSYGLPTRAPGDQRRMHSVIQALLSSPVPDGLRHKREEESRRLAKAAESSSQQPLIYLLSPNRMIDNDYHLPTYVPHGDTVFVPGAGPSDLPEEVRSFLGIEVDLVAGGKTVTDEVKEGEEEQLNRISGMVGEGRSEDGWVETPTATGPPKGGKWRVLALDCEMVSTENGSELARISVLDFDTGENIFDELVKPDAPVIDYRTQWSGITAERLSDAPNTLSSIQAALVTSLVPLITPHTILLGHSLECDLTALRIRHPLCIDTALIFKHPRGPPFKPGLKWLAGKYLDRQIQESAGGHDSEEDARACVDLLKLKMANGPDFGSSTDYNESLFERIARWSEGPTKPDMRTAIIDTTNHKRGLGAKATTAIQCEKDDEDGTVEAICDAVQNHDFVFGRLMGLNEAQGWADVRERLEASSTSTLPPPNAMRVDSALSSFNAHLQTLHARLPSSTALILLTGHSDPTEMIRLTLKRQKWDRACKVYGDPAKVPQDEKWFTDDDRELERAAYDAREGMAFFCVKS